MKNNILFLAGMLLVSCSPPKVLSVLTYNAAPGDPGEDDIREYVQIARYINYELPDIVALQEIDFVSGQEEKIDAVTVFKVVADKESGFTRNISTDNFSRGVGILTDNPPLSDHSIPLPGERGDPVALIHEYSDCIVVSTQFPYDEQDQLAGVAVMDSIASIFGPTGKPIIIAGTMPFVPGSVPFERMLVNWGLLNDFQTSYHFDLETGFDYIWAYTGSSIDYYVTRIDVIDPIRQSSPHRAVIVSFRYVLPKKER